MTLTTRSEVFEATSTTLKLTPGRYRTPRQLCKEINKRVRETDGAGKIRVDYDGESRLASLWWSDSDVALTVGRDVAAMLGCDSGKVYRKPGPVEECSSVSFTRSPDMNAGYHRLYVYCSLCADRMVGDVLAPLLMDVAIPETESTTRAQVDATIAHPQYTPAQNVDTDEMEINIRSGDGEIVPFESGLVSLTVELKPQT